jgi:hypothetical protein
MRLWLGASGAGKFCALTPWAYASGRPLNFTVRDGILEAV